MKKRTTTILFSLIAPVAGILFFAMPADAQAACAVSSAVFRTTKPGGMSASTFYQEADRPYIYLDIHTSGCIGVSGVELSIEGQGLVGPDLNIDGLDDQPLNVGPATDNDEEFTVVLRAGEENCTPNMDPDCQYRIVIENSNGDDLYYSLDGLMLSYDCEGVTCDDGSDWSGIIDIIPFGNVLAADPYAGNGTTDGNVVVPPTPQQPDDPNGESVINLSLVNPIAGTVDTIPEFFQKVVDLVIKIGIPIVAMAIIYSGFLFVSARGDEGQIGTAKNVLWYAILGALLLFASWLVAEAIKDALLSI